MFFLQSMPVHALYSPKWSAGEEKKTPLMQSTVNADYGYW